MGDPESIPKGSRSTRMVSSSGNIYILLDSRDQVDLEPACATACARCLAWQLWLAGIPGLGWHLSWLDCHSWTDGLSAWHGWTAGLAGTFRAWPSVVTDWLAGAGRLGWKLVPAAQLRKPPQTST